jgi:hypothetical protein
MTSGSTCPQNLRDDTGPTSGRALRPVAAAERRQHIWRYIWKTRRMQLVGGALGVVAVVMAVVLIPRLRPPPAVLPTPGDWLSWQQNLQMIFGFATMLVAGLVWYNDLAEEWAQELPCLLTFYFFHEQQPVLICYHAYLAGEDDIRAWSQQIAGRQMAGADLKLRPVVEARPTELLTDDTQVFVHHQARFTLTELPPVLEHARITHNRAMCLVWRPRVVAKPPAPSDAVPVAEAALLSGAANWPVS